MWIEETAIDFVRAIGLQEVKDGWRADLPGTVVNDRGDRQVVRVACQGHPEVAYLKRWRFGPQSPYRFLPGAKALRNRGRSEFQNLGFLLDLGFVVPRPLAFAEERGMWGPVASILLLENLAGYESCLQWGREHPEGHVLVATGVAEIMARLHNRDIYHRSPSLKHFYLPTGPDAGQFALIDVPRLDRSGSGMLEKARSWLGGETPCAERDLSKVLLSLRDELSAGDDIAEAFWTAYLNARDSVAEPRVLRERTSGLVEKRHEARRKRQKRKRQRD